MCGFSSELSTVIRDIFVAGMVKGPIQDRLLEEDVFKIGTTYSFLMEIAITREATMNDKSRLKMEECVDIKYHKGINVSNKANKWSNPSKKPMEKRGVSGCSDHIRKDYIYKDYENNNFNTSNSSKTLKRIPKMIVFDLDFTLWPFLIDAQANPTIYKKRQLYVITNTNNDKSRLLMHRNTCNTSKLFKIVTTGIKKSTHSTATKIIRNEEPPVLKIMGRASSPILPLASSSTSETQTQGKRKHINIFESDS
ncbi:uncharacterized protein LOC112686031 [Sipha flava]|uniref:Uncharacterized protein LOC112686031 n=1 Tax=Sipha flava TaxID=143950 RepID=A0A8B8FT13_9HEMI|nr:uncharacterized protein LOC112686031 [Sipha flava]